MINCDHEISVPGSHFAGKWETLTYSTECQYARDRLYGAWGVPVFRRGYLLPYNNIRHAIKLLRMLYPTTGFAMYTTCRGEAPYPSWRPRDLCMQKTLHPVSDVVHALLTETEVESPPEVDATYYRFRMHPTLVIIVSETIVAFGWAPSDAGNAAEVPIFLSMEKELLQTDKCHDAVKQLFFVIAAQPGGIPNHWATSYELWKYVRTVILHY